MTEADKNYERIESLVSEFAPEGWNCPKSGREWLSFFEWLKEHSEGDNKPKMSLVLAASTCASVEKRDRLIEQLMWADENGILDEALARLKMLSSEEWDNRDYGEYTV